jgi:hypothetical protein
VDGIDTGSCPIRQVDGNCSELCPITYFWHQRFEPSSSETRDLNNYIHVSSCLSYLPFSFSLSTFFSTPASAVSVLIYRL